MMVFRIISSWAHLSWYIEAKIRQSRAHTSKKVILQRGGLALVFEPLLPFL